MSENSDSSSVLSIKRRHGHNYCPYCNKIDANLQKLKRHARACKRDFEDNSKQKQIIEIRSKLKNVLNSQNKVKRTNRNIEKKDQSMMNQSGDISQKFSSFPGKTKKITKANNSINVSHCQNIPQVKNTRQFSQDIHNLIQEIDQITKSITQWKSISQKALQRKDWHVGVQTLQNNKSLFDKCIDYRMTLILNKQGKIRQSFQKQAHKQFAHYLKKVQIQKLMGNKTD